MIIKFRLEVDFKKLKEELGNFITGIVIRRHKVEINTTLGRVIFYPKEKRVHLRSDDEKLIEILKALGAEKIESEKPKKKK